MPRSLDERLEEAALRHRLRNRRLAQFSVLLLLAFAGASHALAWGGKVRLVRKYKLGEEMVYETQIRPPSKPSYRPSPRR